ncbi:phosphoesterase family-domain-containing protein [Absidia repens]|uniref:Phosphoesterase family-domain-containing protein n=1 Tax=Absidia repens TaxID=90262 RepID=A0A1X2IP73_9FUNG|nr:phosphoesterase family-domain-containing protein [Absidia repens]
MTKHSFVIPVTIYILFSFPFFPSTQEPENFIYDNNQQIYNVDFGSSPSKSSKATMGGFLSNFLLYRDSKYADEIMRGLNQSTLPVLYTLAKEYAISDRWFSSVPGSTFPNRNFLHAATSGGVVNNDIPKLGYNFTTIFEVMDQRSISYGIYTASPVPYTYMFRYFRSPKTITKKPFHNMETFYNDCQKGQLPSYVYLEPAMFGLDERLRNDQHPRAGSFYDLRRGELFYKQVYEAIRKSPQWESILFLLVWDEHGGFYDHVPPPTNVVNPDGIVHPTFDFTRLGIRVPAIMISPWIQRGLVLPQNHQLEHASISSTLHDLFGTPYLTRRDQQANTFHQFANLASPRSDCPVSLPEPAWQFDKE